MVDVANLERHFYSGQLLAREELKNEAVTGEVDGATE